MKVSTYALACRLPDIFAIAILFCFFAGETDA